MKGLIFIGLQASGKSTFFLEYFYHTHMRLNMDMLKTRYRETILLNACLEGKQKVVIDNTNPTIKERAKYIQLFKQKKFKVGGYYFQSNIAECLKRNGLRKGKAMIPEVGIKSTFKKLERPSYNEGFDELFYVSLEGNQFKISPWNNEG